MCWLAGALPYVDLQRTCVSQPAALRKAVLQIRDRRQRGVAFAKAILGIRLPIECSVGLRAIQRGKLREFRFGLVEVVFVETFAAIVVQFGVAISLLLFAVALFLLTVALLLFTIPLF